jgi:hypothetical protein
MRRMYLCSQCTSPVVYGDRFCSNCGVELNWQVQHLVSGSSFSDGSCYQHEQQGWNQQSPQNQASLADQVLQDGEQHRYDKLYSEDARPDDSAVTPVRSQIYKLLTELIEKPDKQHHTDN